MSRNTTQQYWYSLTTLVYALVVVAGSYWHYCGQITCENQALRTTQAYAGSIAEDFDLLTINQNNPSSLENQTTCIACLISELRQIDGSPAFELQTIASDDCCNMSSRLFDVGKHPNPISARGPPWLMIS